MQRNPTLKTKLNEQTKKKKDEIKQVCYLNFYMMFFCFETNLGFLAN